MNDQQISIYCDFDGTISTSDIGEAIYKHFADYNTNYSGLIEGRINIFEYWEKLFISLNKGVGKQEIANIALKNEIDQYFGKFVAYCSENNLSITIVSDGFDSYIKPVLEQNGFGNIPLYSNKMNFGSDGSVIAEFPNATESCNCLSASCKRNIVLNNSPAETIIIYIGDGISDYCPANYADIIFAKKQLAAYCSINKLPHYPYSNFFDVQKIIDSIRKKGKLKIRNQAKNLRNLAFRIE